MSSTTRLLVLGVVRLFQPVHGYEVRRELVTWHASEWASVKPGSIYNALKSMTSDGLLEVVSTDQVGGRPERTTYRLTPAGDDEFKGLLRETWWKVQPVVDPLMGAVSFLGMIARDEAIAALEERIAQVRSHLRQGEFVIASHDGSDSPDHVREMMRLMNARMASEIAWAEAFIARLRGGEYATLGDKPWHPPGAKTTIAASRPKAARGRKPRQAPASAAAGAKHALDTARRTRATSGTRTAGKPRAARR
ncbi:MAG TPA: PadR family transcriptional regulator [Kofleriaceae bacterium]|nr:PadR family transcriptional regulator [Kofleriaceae bacterium]